ncbi:one cut domain family member 3-like [Phalacrocorax carbo]|uniref:one cut domain family member 3-like n=1 Tax=Phalacrocorax carbo TaxID=9209 RepID=UPI0031193F59
MARVAAGSRPEVTGAGDPGGRGPGEGSRREAGEAGVRQAGEGPLAPAWSSALLCSSCPGPQPLARPPSARGFEKLPSFPPGLAGACGRCLSRGGTTRAGSAPRLPHGLPSQAAASLPARLRRHILLPPPPPPPPGAAAAQSRLLSAPHDVAAPQSLSGPAGREAHCPAEGASSGNAARPARLPPAPSPPQSLHGRHLGFTSHWRRGVSQPAAARAARQHLKGQQPCSGQWDRTAPHRTAPHRTAPHRTAPHRDRSRTVWAGQA